MGDPNTITLDFEFSCEECGEPLEGAIEFHRGTYKVFIKPCPPCLDEAKDEGAEEVYEEVYTDDEEEEERRGFGLDDEED